MTAHVAGRVDLGQREVRALALHSVTLYEIARGDFERALTRAERLIRSNELDRCVLLADAIEAASMLGATDRADRLTVELLAAYDPSDVLDRGLASRAQALIGTSPVDERFRDAMRSFQLAGSVVQLARTQLLFGEWLRRNGRRAEARSYLERAHARFTALDAQAFVERAAAELAATTPQVEGRDAGSHARLTAQEARIAAAASSGATNAEIARQVHLSRHTIDHHLRNTYRKLGITSRRQLPEVLRLISQRDQRA